MIWRPPGGKKVVGRSSRRYRNGRETLPGVRKWSGDSPGGQEVVWRTSRKSRNGLETRPDVWKW